MMCGRLFCAQPNANAPPPSEFGLQGISTFRVSSISCKMIFYDYGMEAMDPGLAPNGAKCDEGKVRHCRLALAACICGKMDAPITL